jgi:hypothetical protein
MMAGARLVWLCIAFTLAPGALAPQNKPKQNLPYKPIDEPQFVVAAQADFLQPANLLIGVNSGDVVRAYPAAILAQHGLVEDRMPDGPITVTW